MILDKYCQIYVGTTDDIKSRIQQHWSFSDVKRLNAIIFHDMLKLAILLFSLVLF